MDIVSTAQDICDSDCLRKLLKGRDEKEKLPFENLIYTINEYASELESALILVDSLKTSMKRARLVPGNREETGTGGNSSPGYEAKMKELKDERAELYRQQGIQATHLLSLNDQLRSRDTLINALNSEISALKGHQGQNEEEILRLREKVKEGEDGAKVIGDELVALQLELLRLDQWQNERDSIKSTVEQVPKGSMMVVDNVMRLTKEKEITAPHQYPISSFASRPSSRQLLTGSEDQKIILYDLTRISTKLVLKWAQMNGPIVSLAIDEEGGRTVASCSAYDKEVTIWNLASGKIQSSLQFSDDSSDVPLLRFGPQFRLWMALGRNVRLWDVQRGLLLRSWNREVIPKTIERLEIDQKRPDRIWCFDVEGSFTILNAMTGKLEIPWRRINEQKFASLLYDCSIERILVARKVENAEHDWDWILTGYSRNSTSLDGVFEFNVKHDLLKQQPTQSAHIKGLSIHPDRCNLIALILDSNEILIIKVSKDHWTPSTLLISLSAEIDAVHWGPCEDDPITGERGCKIVTIEKESKVIRLYTISKI